MALRKLCHPQAGMSPRLPSAICCSYWLLVHLLPFVRCINTELQDFLSISGAQHIYISAKHAAAESTGPQKMDFPTKRCRNIFFPPLFSCDMRFFFVTFAACFSLPRIVLPMVAEATPPLIPQLRLSVANSRASRRQGSARAPDVVPTDVVVAVVHSETPTMGHGGVALHR